MVVIAVVLSGQRGGSEHADEPKFNCTPHTVHSKFGLCASLRLSPLMATRGVARPGPASITGLGSTVQLRV
jgi:hypothetical protein